MKKKFSKSLIAMLLALMMVISVMSVGILTASSANPDVAATGDSVTEVWFTRPNSWNNTPNVHYWGGASSSSWPGKAMTYKYLNDYNQSVYYTTIPGDSKNIIFNNGNGSYQTVDIPISGSVVAYYINGNETSTSASVKAWDQMPESLLEPITYSLTIDTSSVDVTSGAATVNLPAGSHTYYVLKKQGSSSTQVKRGAYTATVAGTYKVTYDISANTLTFALVQKVRIAIGDDTGDRWIGNDDASLYAYVGGVYTKLTRAYDVASGLKIWYGDVPELSAGASVIFLRASALAKSGDLDYTKANGTDEYNFNAWTATYQSGMPLYKIGDNDTITPASMLEIPDGSVTNFGYGIWVDTKGNADTKDFVKIFANDFVKDTKYTLYLPAYTDWTQLKVYTNFPYLKINNQTVTKGQVNTMNLSRAGIENTVNISFKRNASGSTHSGTLHIMRAGTASALLMTTNDELYTGLTAAYADNGDGTANYEGVAAYKALISTKGKFAFYTNTGEKLNTDDGLKKVKPRGNSTFEASMRLYGKTAYNITLNEKAPLIEGCASSKKYSLLANNADESLMRNMTVYGIADAVGMPYTPNTRLIDLYDNGTYLGAYVLTEKVEYGKNTLIPEAKSSDKLNEEILAAGKGIDYDALEQKTATYTAKSGNTYTYQYSYTTESWKTYEFDGSTVTIGEGETAETYTLDEALMKKYDFLMEHEINGRYQPEATWFVSNRTKQAVVPKYPEFATQKQVQWMIEQYDALETATFNKNYTALSSVADVESFASVYLIQELTENLDAGATSYYILGGKNYPKLVAAPIWDYDWAAGMYNGKKYTIDGEVDVADFTKEFVTKKSVKIAEDDGRTQTTPNLQAKMTQITEFWTLCKTVWTNKFTPVLNETLGDGKTILATYLPLFRTAAAMNEDRWNVLHKMNENPDNYWGTRSTTQYKKGGTSKTDFAVGGNKCTGATFSYDNTVYYLNDWLTQRRAFMDNTLKLYDASLIIPDPTDPPTDEPTDEPTEEPTDEPTDEPTEPATEEPETYLLGDVDGNGEINVLDATVAQRLIAGFTYAGADLMKIRGAITSDTISILDATAIQRYIAGFTNVYNVGSTKTYPAA